MSGPGSESSVALSAGAASGEAIADLSSIASHSPIVRKSSSVLPHEGEHFARVFVAADILTLCSSDGVQ